MAAKKTEAVAAKTNPTGVVAYDYGQQKGVGYEQTTGEDFAIPFLSVLQSNSPQCIPGEVKLEGAEPGMLFNTVSAELTPGDEGLLFIPCATQHVFVEWRPRESGGGFIAVHALGSPVVTKAKAKSKKFGEYFTEEGNELVETFYMWGNVLTDEEDAEVTEQLVIPFTSTKIKKYKKILYRLRTFKGGAPLFANRLRIKTMPETNNFGSYYNFSIQPALGDDVGLSLVPPMRGDVTHPLLAMGEEFMKLVTSGMAKAAYETQDRGNGAEVSDEAGTVVDSDDIPF